MFRRCFHPALKGASLTVCFNVDDFAGFVLIHLEISEWWMLGSAVSRVIHCCSSSSSSVEESDEELVVELELEEAFSALSSFDLIGASLQSGLQGCWMCPERVKSGCNAPMDLSEHLL